jgi:CubicO group peptidase (beta-lactamase class C family)
MKWGPAVLAALLVILSGCSSEKLDPAIASYIDSLMNVSFKPGQPGAVILVARDGIPIFRKAYGRANVELGVPNTPENVFAIGSMTKQFTAVCILQLVRKGKVSLQDDIRKYLPHYNTQGRVITIEHLLTHANGIPNITDGPDFGQREVVEPSLDELLGCVTSDSLLFEPGSDCGYNDYGYTLAGLIIEQVSGLSYGEYVQKNIFEPLGMKSSTSATRERSIPLFVSGYSSAGDTVFRPAEYFSWRWDLGMGDIVTCVDDMLKWDEALYTDKLLSQDLLKKAWSSYVLTDGRKTNYGYGWAVSQYQDVQMIWHTGGIQGFRSTSIRIPSQHLFVIAMSNNGSTNAVISCARDIALRVTGKPLVTPSFQHLTPEQLNDYSGVYETRFSGLHMLANQTRNKVYRYVTVQDTLLVAQRTGAGRITLLNVGGDLFMFEGSKTYARFHRGNNLKIMSMEVYADPWLWGPTRFETRTELPLPKVKVPVVLDEKILKAYIGKYTFSGDDFVKIRVDSLRIYMDTIGEIFPESETHFFSRTLDETIEFIKNSKGSVTGLIWTQLGSAHAKKID